MQQIGSLWRRRRRKRSQAAGSWELEGCACSQGQRRAARKRCAVVYALPWRDYRSLCTNRTPASGACKRPLASTGSATKLRLYGCCIDRPLQALARLLAALGSLSGASLTAASERRKELF